MCQNLRSFGVRPVVEYGVEEVCTRPNYGLRFEEIVRFHFDFRINLGLRYNVRRVLQNQGSFGNVRVSLEKTRKVQAAAATYQRYS